MILLATKSPPAKGRRVDVTRPSNRRRSCPRPHGFEMPSSEDCGTIRRAATSAGNPTIFATAPKLRPTLASRYIAIVTRKKAKLSIRHRANYRSSIPTDATEVVTRCREDGTKESADYYLNGQKVGVRYWYENGQVEFDWGLRSDGSRHGYDFEFAPNGQMTSANGSPPIVIVDF